MNTFLNKICYIIPDTFLEYTMWEVILIRYNTHITCGMFSGALFLGPFFNYILFNFNIFNFGISLILYIYFIRLGSIFPDIDCQQSYLGRRLPLVSRIINSKFPHRSFTHSLLFIYILVFISFIINIFLKVFYPYIYCYIDIYIFTIYYGFILGCVSHIFFDMFNCNGVRLLYPSENKYRLPLAPVIKTGSINEKRFNAFLSFLTDILIILYLFIAIKFFILNLT